MMDCITYEMDWTNGKLVPCKTAPELERGHIIYAYGYAGNLQMFAVLDGKARTCIEINRTTPETVDELPENYFSARGTYEEFTKPHSKKFGIGFYYADNGEELATEEQLQQGLERAEAIERLEAQKKEQNEREFKEQQDRMRKEYGGILTERTGDWSKDANLAGDNLRTLIKRSFPGCKISVRKSRGSGCGNYYYVDWTDGPTREQVQKITELFNDQVRDRYNDDLWESVPDGFTSLYGSLSAICQRKISPEQVGEVRAKLLALFDAEDSDRIYNRCQLLNAAKGEIPAEFEAAIRDFDGWHNTIRDWAYEISHSLDLTPKQEKKQEKKSERISAAGLEIIDYSEKALAVIGDTRPLADTLKKLGGKFNARLSCGAGWIFSKRREAELREALAL